MAGLFQTLELGKRALLTHQVSLQTTGHNIANVNTPGYTRQRVSISATLPEYNTKGMIGTGVQANDITAVRDLFLGNQFRQESKSLGQWAYKEKTLTQIESFFGEPNDNTLSDLLNQYWDSWADLSTMSDSASSRTAILQQANLLVNGLHSMATQLQDLQTSIDADTNQLTSEINQMSTEIAKLNGQIKRSELGTANANDLRDSRDLLIDQLSTLVDVNTVDRKDGGIAVYVGGMVLVDGDTALKIDAETTNNKGSLRTDLVWMGTDFSFKNMNGQLKGLMDSRDNLIPSYIDELNTITKTLVDEVNALHRSGYGLDGSTGVNFFDPRYTDASTVRINTEITANPSRIVASASGEIGDNTIALAMQDLRDKKMMNDGTETINSYYNSLVGTLGIQSSEAQSFTSNYELLVQQIDTARESVQGVSLDEEMTNMVVSQHAYDAAARIITAMDEALDTVIKGMGVVGR